MLVSFERDWSGKGPGDIVVALGYDMRSCKGVLDPTLHASFNGRPMSVFPGHARGWYQDPCGAPGFRVARISSDGTAALSTIVISDRSMTITAEFDDLFAPRSASFTGDPLLRAGTEATLDWFPASDRYVDARLAAAPPRISFSYDGHSADPNARQIGDPPAWQSSGAIEKGKLSVRVPGDAVSGPGTLRIQTEGNHPARRCDGAESCIAWPAERVRDVHARVAGSPGPPFQLTANQVEDRYDASATRLDDGKVLLAGGVRNGAHLRSAEVWDPQTRTWTATAPMIDARSDHGAISLGGGRVLVVGGRSFDHLNDDRFCAAGRRAEIWQESTGTWAPTPCLPQGQKAFVKSDPMRLHDGRIVVATEGIDLQDSSALVSFDERKDAWSVLSQFARRDDYALAMLGDGRVLRLGGSKALTGGRPTPDVAAFDPRTKSWADLAPMLVPRRAFQALALHDGRIFVVGGISQIGSAGEPTEIYDPTQNSWSAGPALRFPRGASQDAETATVLADGRVLVKAAGTVQTWLPGEPGWKAVGKTPVRGSFYSLVPFPDGTVLIAAGSLNGGVSDYCRFAN